MDGTIVFVCRETEIWVEKAWGPSINITNSGVSSSPYYLCNSIIYIWYTLRELTHTHTITHTTNWDKTTKRRISGDNPWVQVSQFSVPKVLFSLTFCSTQQTDEGKIRFQNEDNKHQAPHILTTGKPVERCREEWGKGIKNMELYDWVQRDADAR